MSISDVAKLLHDQMGTVLANNSTVTPLTAAATYTGTWVKVPHYSQISTLVNTDQSGTLYIDYSIDSVVNDYTRTFSITGGTAAAKSVSVLSKYMRVRYINGGVNQTTFRMQTMAHKYKSNTVD